MFLTRRRTFAGLVIVLVCSIACSILTVAAYHVFFSRRTVVMDIAGFIASQKEGYAAGRVSAGELVQNIDSLMSRIRAAKANDVLVVDRKTAGLPKEGTAVGAPDPSPDDDDDGER